MPKFVFEISKYCITQAIVTEEEKQNDDLSDAYCSESDSIFTDESEPSNDEILFETDSESETVSDKLPCKNPRIM